MSKMILFQQEILTDGLAELAELANLLCEIDRENRGAYLLSQIIRDTLFDFYDRLMRESESKIC